MKKIIKVAVGIPNEGHIDPMAYDDRLTFFHHLGKLQVASQLQKKRINDEDFYFPKDVVYKFHLITVGKVLTPYARETIAKEALKSEMDYLFFIDDDMLCPVDIFEKLVKHNKDIVGALAFTRAAPHKPVIYSIKSGWDPVAQSDYFINYSIYNYPKNTLVECDAVGFGAALIKTEILKKIKKPWFMTTSGAGEDIVFCHKARESGFRTFADTSIKLGHVGYPHVITEETYEAQEHIKRTRKYLKDYKRK